MALLRKNYHHRKDFFVCRLAVCVTNKMRPWFYAVVVAGLVQAVSGLCCFGWAQSQPLTFSAFGDIPYGSSEYAILQKYVADHNRYSPSTFIIHIGDMLLGSCDESKYADMAGILKEFAVPVYIVVGDNEYNDCANPTLGLSYWKKYFLNFEQKFCGAPATEHQSVRPENLAFTINGVLFIGINLVGGSLHDQNEWNTRLQEDADWVSQQFQAKGSQVRAAVVFAQAGPEGSANNRGLFFDQFRPAAAAFGKPVLYIQGNTHTYKLAQPWPEKNITQLVVPKANLEPPLEVTVTMDSNPQRAFTVKRNPWGTTPYNMPPCVNAGSDQTIQFSSTATLKGEATDDGDPNGTLTTTWSQISGPGATTFGNAKALTTTASFSAPGAYVLSLTASDSQLQKSDEVTIIMEAAVPSNGISINDVSIIEGNSGTSAAVFTVSLSRSNGQPVMVDYQIVNGTAINGDDYVANPGSGTLTFNGATTQTITVMINGDVVDEQRDETFFINLSNAINVTITDQQGVGTIINDDKPVPPSAPSNLSATANAASRVTIAWNDNSANEDGFKIERKIGGTFNQIGIVGANVITYTDTGLNGNTAYVYRVRAYNVAGNSAYTKEASAVTPAGVSALTVNTVGSGNVSLNPTGGVYNDGTVVTLIPQSGTGFQFSGWSGDLSGSSNPATITMKAPKTVTATFTPLPAGIVHEETRIGGASNSTTVTTFAPQGGVTGGNGHLYLAAISMRPKVSVLSVSGLGLNWTLVRLKCAGRNTTAIEVWMAQGAPTSNGVVTATFASTPSTAAIAVSHYSDVSTSNPIGNVLAGNTRGVNAAGACSGGVDSNSYSFNLTTTMNGAVVYGAIALKGRTHTPGAGYTERTEVQQVSGTNTSGVAVEDKIVASPSTITINGSFGNVVDWAVVALEIKPPSPYTLTVNNIGSGVIVLNPPGGTYNQGTVVTLTAIPQGGTAGFEFSGWSGDLTPQGGANPATITMNANKSVTAIFAVSSNTNLAKNRLVTASSSYAGKPSENAVDGSTNTYWRSGSLSSGNPAWLRVDLGAAMPVGRVIVRWKQSYYAKSYEVQVSNDEVNWTPAYNATGKSGDQTFNFSPTSARCVRLYFKKNNKSSYQLSEFEVYPGLTSTPKRSSEAVAETSAPDELLPEEFVLEQNYPNPFSASGISDNPGTRISFSLPSRLAGSRVTIKVYAIDGAEVATLVDGQYPAGRHAVEFTPKNLPSGAYFYVMQAGEVRKARQLMLLK